MAVFTSCARSIAASTCRTCLTGAAEAACGPSAKEVSWPPARRLAAPRGGGCAAATASSGARL
jgi:hypothetical protein